MEAIIVFIFGLIFGSFLNVVILRFDDWLSILKGRSQCPKCKTNLGWYDLVPLVSYITLRGKCRYCTKPISWQYPVVEFATAALLTSGYATILANPVLPLWQAWVEVALFALILGVILVIFFHDLYEMMIPEVLSYILVIAALAFSLIYYNDALGTLYAALTGFLPIALLVFAGGGKWMGEGDIKLSAGLALLVGWPSAVAYLAFSFIGGGLFGVAAIAAGRAKLKSAIPFAPFLILAAFVTFFYGPRIVGWYLGILGYGYY